MERLIRQAPHCCYLHYSKSDCDARDDAMIVYRWINLALKHNVIITLVTFFACLLFAKNCAVFLFFASRARKLFAAFCTKLPRQYFAEPINPCV